MVQIDQTHAQRDFGFDANKEYDWDASVAIRPNQNLHQTKIANWLLT